MAWPPTTHQDVQDEITNARGASSSLNARLIAAEAFGREGQSVLPTVSTGRYFGRGITSTSAVSLTANFIYLHPLLIRDTVSVDRIAAYVSTAAPASSVARLGLYNSSATTLLPTTVAFDAGTVAVDTTGEKAITISQSLRGLYWAAFTWNAASGQVYGATNSVVPPIVGPTGLNSAGVYMFAFSSPATSALPNLTGQTLVFSSASTIPIVALRAA